MIKILILESNEEFAKEMAEYFASNGFEVCGISSDGGEAVDLIEKLSPDVTVLSLLLQRMDGMYVMEETRRRGKKTEFIVLGNYADDRIISEAISLGARYYFMKPVGVEVVAGRISSMCKEGEEVPGKPERRRGATLDERITGIFMAIGVPPHIKGYSYLREGIKMTVADPQVIGRVTKGLYPVIGEKYNTSASKVERAIRHAIDVTWNRGRIDALNAIFGARVYIGTEKPTNSEFIALIADKLILEDMV